MREENTTVVNMGPADKHETTTQTVNKEFTFELTKEEMVLKGREIGSYRSEIAKEEAAFKERKQQNAATLTRLENNINNTVTILSEGKELRTVECTMIKDFATSTARFVFDGTVMEERPLTKEELQLEMGPVLVGRTQAATQVPTMVESADNELQQAIREETNPRTKHSSVDGPLGE